MRDISARLTALERWRLEQMAPVDPLSCSLDGFDRWLADLDPFSLADALADGDGRQILTPAQAERMLDGYHAARR